MPPHLCYSSLKCTCKRVAHIQNDKPWSNELYAPTPTAAASLPIQLSTSIAEYFLHTGNEGGRVGRARTQNQVYLVIVAWSKALTEAGWGWSPP